MDQMFNNSTRDLILLAAASRNVAVKKIKDFIINNKWNIESLSDSDVISEWKFTQMLNQAEFGIFDERMYHPMKLKVNDGHVQNIDMIKELKDTAEIFYFKPKDALSKVYHDVLFSKAHKMVIGAGDMNDSLSQYIKYDCIKADPVQSDRFNVEKFHSVFFYDGESLIFYTQIMMYDKGTNTYCYVKVVTRDAKPYLHMEQILWALLENNEAGSLPKDSLYRYYHVFVYHYVRHMISQYSGYKMDTGTDIYRIVTKTTHKYSKTRGDVDIIKTNVLLDIALFYIQHKDSQWVVKVPAEIIDDIRDEKDFLVYRSVHKEDFYADKDFKRIFDVAIWNQMDGGK